MAHGAVAEQIVARLGRGDIEEVACPASVHTIPLRRVAIVRLLRNDVPPLRSFLPLSIGVIVMSRTTGTRIHSAHHDGGKSPDSQLLLHNTLYFSSANIVPTVLE